ncbi:Protein FAR1-RELATED SEQUENCE 5 [Hordeum vulgare]|nr:Protein FAR1-RELATED SEQUENCE 5 [Hordeum vulgare]
MVSRSIVTECPFELTLGNGSHGYLSNILNRAPLIFHSPALSLSAAPTYASAPQSHHRHRHRAPPPSQPVRSASTSQSCRCRAPPLPPPLITAAAAAVLHLLYRSPAPLPIEKQIMAKVELQVEPWQERGIQVMVLLSFTLQLVLLVLAEFRRRMDSGVLRSVIWSAYMLADSTAVYTLGHLSVTSRSDDHELMSLWAPFLLLHLGGQDNITAYAIEDNRLWLRHLQALVVQVAAAAYVLYESTVIGIQALLRDAAYLIFVVGVIKYGERVWALKCADTSASGNEYRYFEGTKPPLINPGINWHGDTEDLLRIAHHLLDVAKNLFQGQLPVVLSLMHDVLYSKAEVIHTWYGLCVRAISPVFIAVAFLLLHRSGLSLGDHHYDKADVAITFVLLGGAVILEMASVLKAIFSRWSTVLLGSLAYDAAGQRRCMWSLVADAMASIRRFVLPKRDGSKWWWSNSMGQHNLFDLCVYSRDNRVSGIACRMGVEVWWSTMICSKSIPVPEHVKTLLTDQMVKGGKTYSNILSEYLQYKKKEEEECHIMNSRGRSVLWKTLMGHKEKDKFLHMEFDESILVCHIATHIYILGLNENARAQYARDLEAIQVISNYMLFILAVRPYMLPGSINRTRYTHMCSRLKDLEWDTTIELANKILHRRWAEDINDTTLVAAHHLAWELVRPRDSPMEPSQLAQVWTEMLCYAGYRCSGYSHVKQLSNGGELLTVAALVVDYCRRNIRTTQPVCSP